MKIPSKLIKKKLFMFFKSLICFKNGRSFHNVYCSVYSQFQKLFLSASFIITILHINIPGIVFSLLFLALIFFVLRYIEDQIIYPVEVPPEARWCVALPSQYNLPYEELVIETEDNESLSAYLILQPMETRKSVPTILFCHGNAGNMGSRLLNMAQLYKFCQVNVLIFDYRGYGRSTGKPSEKGLYQDARLMIKYLASRSDIDSDNIVIFGRSLGGAVAIETAMHFSTSTGTSLSPVSALIVENTFTSIPAAAKHLFWRLPYASSILDMLLRNQFQSINKVERLGDLPVLFISGDKDAFIPPTMMLELYSRCPPARKSLNRVPNGDHNNTWTRPGYFEAINSFLGTALRPRVRLATVTGETVELEEKMVVRTV